MANKYRKGADYERHIQDLWESLGASVIRSSGSHGEADLWIMIGKQVIMAQIQTNDYFPPTKIEALQELAKRHDAVAILYWKQDKGIRSKII